MRRIHSAAALCVACRLIACASDEPTIDIPTSNGRTPAPYDPGTTYSPRVTAAELSAGFDHRLFPARVGARWELDADGEDGREHIVVEVLAETKTLWGAIARVLRDTVALDGELVEDTWD